MQNKTPNQAGRLRLIAVFFAAAAVCFALIFLPKYYRRRLHTVQLQMITHPVQLSWTDGKSSERRTISVGKPGLAWDRVLRIDTPPQSAALLDLEQLGRLLLLDRTRLTLFPSRDNWFFLKYGTVLFQNSASGDGASTPWPRTNSLAAFALPATVDQGQSVVIRAETGPGVTNLVGYFLGSRLYFSKEAQDNGVTRWTAMQGVDVGVTPGTNYLYLRAVSAGGSWLLRSYPLTVKRRVYGVYRKPAGKAARAHKASLAKSKWWKDWQKKKQRVLSGPAPRQEYRIVVDLMKTRTPVRLWGTRFYRPVRRMQRISSIFGLMRYLTRGSGLAHRGIDYAAWSGTPVYAAARGKVIFSAKTQVRGNFIVIDHGLGVLTVYMHLLSLAVKEGEPVEAGQMIGRVGSTGLSTGPHLHFEIRAGGVSTDPEPWFRGRFPGLNRPFQSLAPGR